MRHVNENHDARLARLTDAGFLPRFLDDGTPCAVTESGVCAHRVIIAYVPKAGTYLVSAVLEGMGLRETHLHLDSGHLSDYRNFVRGSHLFDYSVKLPLADSSALIQPGQFAVGHLPSDPETATVLRDFKILFAQRELRHALVSWARFVVAKDMDRVVASAARKLKDGPERVYSVLSTLAPSAHVPRCKEMTSWPAHGALPVRFETLVGEEGSDAQVRLASQISDFLGLSLPSLEIVRRCVGADTLTQSGRRSELATHWDQRLEDWFHAQGLDKVNHALGYSDDVWIRERKEAA